MTESLLQRLTEDAAATEAGDAPPGNAIGLTYALSSHVRACRVDNHVVLLDLLSSRYVAVMGRRFSALDGVLHGWPQSGSGNHIREGTAGFERALKPLVARGLVAKTAWTTPEPLVTLPPPARSLDAEFEAAGANLGLRRAVQFLRAIAFASCGLRFRSLLSLKRAIEGRRTKTTAPARDAHTGSILESVASYLKQRPLVASSRDRCLHDALSLCHFLGSENIFPRWVIGVRGRPFSAHSWLQQDDLVLSDTVEHVAPYRPILIV